MKKLLLLSAVALMLLTSCSDETRTFTLTYQDGTKEIITLVVRSDMNDYISDGCFGVGGYKSPLRCGVRSYTVKTIPSE